MSNQAINTQYEWALLGAAWGDVLCSLSAVYDSQIKKVLYVGNTDANLMKDFLLAQDFIDEVISINVNDLNLEDYLGLWVDCIFRNQTLEQKLTDVLLKASVDIPYSKIFNACSDYFAKYNKIYQLENVNLPIEIIQWAYNFLKDKNIYNFILVNPYSFNSTTTEMHWPLWHEYIDWLISHSQYHYVFVGCDYELDNDLNRDNVTNLINLLPSNLHVFALSLYASSTITTSNSLAHWCNSRNLVCTNICNTTVSGKYDYFNRILNENTIYSIKHSDNIDIAKIITKKINFKVYDEMITPLRNLYLENQLETYEEKLLYYLTGKIKDDINFRMEPIFVSLPFMTYEDFSTDWFLTSDLFDVMYRIAKIIKPHSYYEIGGRLGHGIISICYGSENISEIGWCDNETYVNESNLKLAENLKAFNKKYNKNIKYSYVDNMELVPEHILNYEIVTIDGEHTFEGKIRDLNIAKNSGAKLILVDDYFWESPVRYAIRHFAKNNNLKLHLIHTFRGLALFDMTPNELYINELKNNGIVIDSLNTEIIKY